MAVDPPDTLPPVAKTKRVSPTVLAAFARVLKKLVDEEYDGNQTRAGKDLGVTQSHISAMQLGVRGPGLNTLLLMREKTHMTIDDMLGLPPVAPRPMPKEELFGAVMEAMEEMDRRREEAKKKSARAWAPRITPAPSKRKKPE